MKTSLSVVISAFNEEKKIGRCIGSVTKWADEVIVVNNSSTDQTGEVAKKLGAKVFRRTNNPMLNINKNWGFTKAAGDWILNLDADEEVPGELAAEIEEKIKRDQNAGGSGAVGYWIPRKNIIFGRFIEHGLWWPDRHLRLFKKDLGKFPCKHVHEYLEVQGKTETLTTPFVHYNYETVSQFIRKMDTIYTENEVGNLIASGYQFAWHDAIRFPVSDFLKVYFAQQGYKDGLHGFVLSLLQAFYSFVVFVKLWERKNYVQVALPVGGVVEELAKVKKDTSYWIETAYARDSASVLSRLWHRVLRRIKTR